MFFVHYFQLFVNKLSLFLTLLVLLALTTVAFARELTPPPPSTHQVPTVTGPFMPVVFTGDLRQYVNTSATHPQSSLPALPSPPSHAPPLSFSPLDAPPPTVQTAHGPGHMPIPIANFDSIRGDEGGGMPPDPTGAAGEHFYIQAANTAIAIFEKATGSRVAFFGFNDFFQGTNTPCDDSHRGDPIVLYDHLAGRWLITSFAFTGDILNDGPYYECLAISQTTDPLTGGWYFYALQTDANFLADYPKLSLWPDAYYMSANMLGGPSARVWALDRMAMLQGDPLYAVSFDIQPYHTLLPAHLQGPPPAEGAPNPFIALDHAAANLLLWNFYVDWQQPERSTFQGPTALPIAPYECPMRIPQPYPGDDLDAWCDLMFPQPFRVLNDGSALWATHSVLQENATAIRWYEIRDPFQQPTIVQQGVYAPDDQHRWMQSLNVDRDGNLAIGFTASNETEKPSIRYTGRLAGETPGWLPQKEFIAKESTAMQQGSHRWGDYSSMMVDPEDDCTFWFTHEYYDAATPTTWRTAIVAFRYPGCGQPKGILTGAIMDDVTGQPIAQTPILAVSDIMTFTTQTNAEGWFSVLLPSGVYTLTAGPLDPGYPILVQQPNIAITPGITTTVSLTLTPKPMLAMQAYQIVDAPPLGNGNGAPEPGESRIALYVGLTNTGVITATQVTATISSATPGIFTINTPVPFPDIPPNETITNTLPFQFNIAPTISCGAPFTLTGNIFTAQGEFSLTLPLRAQESLPPQIIFQDDVENGGDSWVTNADAPTWKIITDTAHSPTHAWGYVNQTGHLDVDAWLQSPPFDLRDKQQVSIQYWQSYALTDALEQGALELSLDDGRTWQIIEIFPDTTTCWSNLQIPLPEAEGNDLVRFRFHVSSSYHPELLQSPIYRKQSQCVQAGWYVDDITLWHQPYQCTYQPATNRYFLPLFSYPATR